LADAVAVAGVAEAVVVAVEINRFAFSVSSRCAKARRLFVFGVGVRRDSQVAAHGFHAISEFYPCSSVSICG
jgi:hypothetical protein